VVGVGGLIFGLELTLESRPAWILNGGRRGSVSGAYSVMSIVGCCVVGSAESDLTWKLLE
jgi:hypothetical protein